MSTPSTIIEEEQLAPIENIAFEGGGVKGLVYVGGMKALEEKGQLEKVKRVGGSSAGGITALLVGLGYNYTEILHEMNKMNFGNFQDSTGEEFWRSIPNVMKEGETKTKVEAMMGVLLNQKRGAYKGEAFIAWAQTMIANRLGDQYANATFADIQKLQALNLKDPKDPNRNLNLKEMMFTGTNISKNGAGLQIFDVHHTPDVRLVDAVRATMSFPGAFEAHPITIKGVTSYFVDGGAVSNHPMEYYDQTRYLPEGHEFDALGINPGTLGLRVDTAEEIRNYKWFERGIYIENEAGKLELRQIEGPPGSVPIYIKGMVSGLTSERHKVYDRGFHVVQIPDCDVKTLNFLLTDEEKKKLLDSGYEATTKYLELYRKGAIAAIKKYKDLRDFCQEKVKDPKGVKTIEDKKKELLAELGKLTIPSKEVSEAQRGEERKRINDIMIEIRIIDKALTPLKRTKEEEVKDKVEKFIQMKLNLATTQQIQLEETLEEIKSSLVTLQDISKRTEDASLVFGIMTSSDENRKLLDNVFQSMKALHTELMDKQIKITLLKEKGKEEGPDAPILEEDELSAKTRTLEHELSGIANQGIDAVLLRLTKALENESIARAMNPDQIKLARKMFALELEGIRKQAQPKSLEEFGKNLKESHQESEKNIRDLQAVQTSFQKHLDANQQQLKRFQSQAQTVGTKIDNMHSFSNSLNEFIAKQKRQVAAIKIVRKICAYAFTGVVPMLVYDLVTHYKGTPKILKKIENSFNSTLENTTEQGEKLKSEIYGVLNAWQKEDNPSANIQKYKALLEGAKQKLAHVGAVLFSKESKKELGRLIETEIERVVEKERPSGPSAT